MIIKKIINNNVAIAGKNNTEYVVMGKGIAYGAKAGDQVKEELIEKIFIFKDKSVFDRLETLIEEIPTIYLKITEAIVELAESKLKCKLNENIYISLTDHLAFAVERLNQKMEYPNAMLAEIKRFYQEEFKIGMESLDIIYKTIGVRLSEDEAGFIALHIVNSSVELGMGGLEEVTHIISEVEEMVLSYFGEQYDKESMFYQRFLTHLRFFAQCIHKKESSGENLEYLYEIVTPKFKEETACVEEISRYIEEKYNYKVKTEEQALLIVHIKCLREKCKLTKN